MSSTKAPLIAQSLLEKDAVFLRPHDPFTWTSGIKSPIYCDNRLLISQVEVRRFITKAFVELIETSGLHPDVIAGTATAGIPWASWIAEELALPMVYVRASAKSHGRQNLIEGKVPKGSGVLVVEDLISTGKSSLQAVEALRQENVKVLAVTSLFHYNFPQAHAIFASHQVRCLPLCTLDDMLSWAVEHGQLQAAEAAEIKTWRQNLNFP